MAIYCITLKCSKVNISILHSEAKIKMSFLAPPSIVFPCIDGVISSFLGPNSFSVEKRYFPSINRWKVIENDAENAAVQSTELIDLFEHIFVLLKSLNEDEISFKHLVSSFQSIVTEAISVYHCAMKDNRTILRRKINKSRQGSTDYYKNGRRSK